MWSREAESDFAVQRREQTMCIETKFITGIDVNHHSVWFAPPSWPWTCYSFAFPTQHISWPDPKHSVRLALETRDTQRHPSPLLAHVTTNDALPHSHP